MAKRSTTKTKSEIMVYAYYTNGNFEFNRTNPYNNMLKNLLAWIEVVVTICVDNTSGHRLSKGDLLSNKKSSASYGSESHYPVKGEIYGGSEASEVQRATS